MIIEKSPTTSTILTARGIQHNNHDNRQKKGRPWYNHCQEPSHTQNKSWKIHDKHVDWKHSKSTPDKKKYENHAFINEEPLTQ